jgi:phenylpyruvate tautomerase PptA (4-oxalocrotonate tautomerase family)
MPLVHIHLRAGKNSEYLRAVAEGIHHALVSEANVPADDRFQLIHQYPPETMFHHPSYAGSNRTDDLIIVEITLNAGRTLEVKKQLYAAIARNLQADPGVRTDDVLVSLIEVSKENWSFGRGLATYAE